MIELKGISKQFDQIQAVEKIEGVIREGSIFGLVGTNGSGKSTCLRMIAGILKPDEGEVLVDGENVYENPEKKRDVFFISDDQFYLPNATCEDMKDYYRIFYPSFDQERFDKLLTAFKLDGKRKINTFSKGMKKQLSVILGVCANTKYMLCDESFDGLDPVMRQAVKTIFIQEMTERDFTPVIASHNLRELEDICDHVGLLHNGGILLSKDLDEMKENIFKIQCVVREEDREKLVASMDVIYLEQRGSLLTLTVRGTRESITKQVEKWQPVFWEILPLTLEEIFISETEVAGYDIKNLLL